ncbi:YggT family protein [Campylobacter hyointestinalis]|uniref:YggT family protein n=1 Tax=Campylobacter hyointestinalis TaxID=198 RepID=UPI000751A43E|nr:YggT family protein [Campylobacter hyointestinalis]PPB53924.1 YggT family protein [Campylobacter hyointestinalis subsp. hyointestinalis]
MVLSMFLAAVANLLHIVITAYTWVIIAAALVSWVNPDPYNKVVQILYRITTPAYELVHKTHIPTVFGGIDIAPIIVLLVLQFLDMFVVGLLFEIANKL